MASLTLRAAQVLTGATRRQYRLIEQAAKAPHIWIAQSLRQAYLTHPVVYNADFTSSDLSKVVIKSPLRAEPGEQWYACQTLNQEIDLLAGRFKGASGILQLLDRITLLESPERIDAAVLEYGVLSLHDLQFSVKRPLSRNQVKAITRQLLTALQFIHAQGIVHTGKLSSVLGLIGSTNFSTDIKPENIVFTRLPDGSDPDLEVKMIDFGIASHVDNEWLDQKNNPYWRSPESWLDMPLTPATEIWALGSIVGSLIMGPQIRMFRPTTGARGLDEEGINNYVRGIHTLFPFPESFLQRASKEWQVKIAAFSNHPSRTVNGKAVTAPVVKEMFEIHDYDWKIVEDMLKVDPQARPTAEQLLRHPWLNPLPYWHPRKIYRRLRIAFLKAASFLIKKWMGLRGQKYP
ncbi:hypothetical protein MMC30_002569 [Trapelia coarctata]|nr:hypothetical protein [Trapelia coarctata]